jgi:hypothetical protein
MQSLAALSHDRPRNKRPEKGVMAGNCQPVSELTEVKIKFMIDLRSVQIHSLGDSFLENGHDVKLAVFAASGVGG